jgi:hypothetical protein
MAHAVRYWPATVYPGEAKAECPEAMAVIDTLFWRMRSEGPKPIGYDVKPLGAKLSGLWQLNLKVKGRQVRILYAPFGQDIVLFRIHKKSSPQEQKRAYRLAGDRKRDYEKSQDNA